MSRELLEQQDSGLDINSIVLEANSLKEEASSLKKRVREAFSDKTIPLQDRWSVWVDLPDIVKEEFWRIIRFPIEDRVGSITEHFDRRDTIHLPDYVADLESNLEWFRQRSMPYNWTQELIDEFKEQILEQNLVQFVVDW
jgi:hypothetical protein